MNDIDMDVADAIMERPKGFEIGGRHFYLYPASLGKTYLTLRLIKSLNLQKYGLGDNPVMAVSLAIKKNPEMCCRLIAYSTLNEREDLFNEVKVKEISDFFGENMEFDDMASLIMVILTDDKSAEICKHFKLDKERDRMNKAQEAKKNNNTFTFFGKTEWGSLIDYACERYGWTFQYVVWGISLVNLMMLNRDSIKSVYLTDEERKKVHISNDNTVIKADDPNNWDLIKNMNWK